ncbi:hypothetical protein NQ314_020993 [Rhamnusium bicolor]|uniref:DDE Tnp4 domain-containing protein n=1 Tax=Rhamnusium bicolor TaxID=1586634 RepID=A0AAV8WJA6_9CUCU|nr:hypothetical protein NQ314_020993 [Rhamnusium bicolor]
MFRLSKALTQYFIECLTPHMRPKNRETDLDIKTRVLIALKFYAEGRYQLDIACNKYLDVSQSTVSRCLAEVTGALNRPDVFNEWVKFPHNFEKLNKTRLEFYNQHGFPGVIGCIDYTHVAIYPPNIEHSDYPEYLYVNRKSHSINVQLICDANLKILNICARYPGSTHDSFIWNHSNVQTLMRNLHQRTHTDYYLLGDSGYPLRSWLLTPLEEEPAQNTPEHTYNSIHKTTRVKIECCNGLLKGRFRCLIKHRVLHYNPAFSCKIINACAVLHNMCIEYNIPAPDLEGEENEEDNAFRRVNPELANGRRARSKVIQIFARRRDYNI